MARHRLALPGDLLAAWLAAAGLMVTSGSPVHAATSYVLSCRSGGNMTIELHSGSDGSGAWIVFHRGNYAGSVQPVRSDDCTWIDRGMLESEPTRLLVSVNDAFVSAVIRANGTVERFNYSCKERERSIDKRRSIIDSVLQDRPFQFHAHTVKYARGDCLKVTRIGP